MSIKLMNYRWLSIVVVFTIALLSGCGGGSSTSSNSSGTSGAPPPLVPAPRTSGGKVVLVNGPATAQQFQFVGYDPTGQVAFGPVTYPGSPMVTVTDVPTSVITVGINAVRDGVAISNFVTSVDLTSTPAVVANPAFVASDDAVIDAFSTVGCNRLATADVAVTPSSANAAQLVQTFYEIAQLRPHSRYMFLSGDLVTNLVPGTQTLTQQLTAWKQFYTTTALPGSGTQLAAMPGNHEMLIKLGNGNEIPNPPTGGVFTNLMAPFLLGNNGPTPAAPNPDNVQRDESQLSYTFQQGDTFYMVLNTDTWEGGLTNDDNSRVPLTWIGQHLAAANADPTVMHIFVFGHKPVSATPDDAIGDAIAPGQATQFYALMQAPNGPAVPTKVRAYICAHAHLWQKGIPVTIPSGTVVQIIAGNAGSSTDPTFQPPFSYYGYTMVERTAAGRFVVESWGRPVPTPYDSQLSQPNATLRERFTLFTP